MFSYNIIHAITSNPIITLYIAKTLKLPFFKYSNKNFITNIPTIKLNNTPNTKAIIPVVLAIVKYSIKSPNLNTVAAKTIGGAQSGT